MCGATAWLSHSAGPRLTLIMSRSVSGVVVSASPGRNAPMVFTSTSGGPTSPAIRPMKLFAAAGSVVSATSRPTPSGGSRKACSFRSTATRPRRMIRTSRRPSSSSISRTRRRSATGPVCRKAARRNGRANGICYGTSSQRVIHRAARGELSGLVVDERNAAFCGVMRWSASVPRGALVMGAAPSRSGVRCARN